MSVIILHVLGIFESESESGGDYFIFRYQLKKYYTSTTLAFVYTDIHDIMLFFCLQNAMS